MDWKKLFSRTILDRGRNYYNQKKIVNYEEDDDEVSAIVLGSRMYEVVIERPGMNNVSMHCSCPYAQDGFYCKHMAAVMYRWQDGHESSEAEDNNKSFDSLMSDLIPPPEKGNEPFYCIPRILSGESVSRRTVKEATDLKKKGSIYFDTLERINNLSVYSYGEDEDAPVRAKGAYEPPNDEYIYPLEIRMSTKKLGAFHCSACGRYYDGYDHPYYKSNRVDLCSHLLALLSEVNEYTKLFDPGDYTDQRAWKFLDAFSTEAVRSIARDREELQGGVVLEPRLLQTDSAYELNFRIGNGGKLYVVKNLTELQHKVSKREKYELGKNSSIDFSVEDFDERSRLLYEMIEGEVKRMEAAEEKMQSRRTYYYGGTLEAGKGIPFTGSAVDTIYELMHGRQIDFKGEDDSKFGKLTVLETDPEVRIFVDITEGGKNGKHRLESVDVSGRVPLMIEGVRSRYFISNGYLSRLDEEMWSRIRPFTEAAWSDGTFSFKIGHNQATKFYYDILPGLREDPSFVIEEKNSAEGMIPEKAGFAFYIDVEDDDILCEVEATYGDITEKIGEYKLEDLPLPPYREMNQEIPVLELMDELFSAYDQEKQAYILADEDDARFELLKYGVPRMMERGSVHSTEAFSAIKIRRTPSVQIGVSVENDLLNLDIVTQDMSYEELGALLQSYRQKKKYHRLRNGEFVDLAENESIDSLMTLMESAGVSLKDFIKGKIQIPAYRALYLDKMLEGHEELVAGRDRHFRNLIRNFKTISDADFDIPLAMDGVLRPYQDYGFKWLSTLSAAGFGGILADDMGLGKTLQVLTLLQSAKESPREDGVSGTSLVVCPASVVYNWIEEISRFTPELKAAAVAGTKSERKQLLCRYSEYDILVTSYDLLKRDIDLYEELSFSYQILDEAQFVKNAKAVAAKSVKLVHAKHRFALTGTPIENRLSELWSIFDYLMPGFLYNYDNFRKNYELPISKHNDEAATEALKNMISPFVLRRKKQDVLKDLPDKIEEIRYARMGDKQRKVYDAQALRVSKLIKEKGDVNTGKIEILAELTRIRQICCDPNLIFSDYEGESAKREACLDLVMSAADAGHKMLLFSQFTSMLALLEDDLKKEGIAYYKLTGETSKEERMRLVKAFNSDKTPVFLISLKAGGTGLNLTGADIVIHYDPWWNLAAQDQATDRAHRIGQTKDVTVFKLIAKDTIEEKIVKLQETKKELADAVLSGETRSLGAMSKEELLALLS